MWWTGYRFENPWAIGRLVIWSGRRGATLTNEIPGANFARLVLTRSLPMTFFTQSEFSCFYPKEFLMNSAWNFEEFCTIPTGEVKKHQQSSFHIHFNNSYSFQEFLFISRILICFKNSDLGEEFLYISCLMLNLTKSCNLSKYFSKNKLK